jgi:hypothetical protein
MIIGFRLKAGLQRERFDVKDPFRATPTPHPRSGIWNRTHRTHIPTFWNLEWGIRYRVHRPHIHVLESGMGNLESRSANLPPAR